MSTPPANDPLASWAELAPNRVAVVEGDASTSYAAFNTEVNRLANGLRVLGLRPGEIGVWCGPNSRQVLAFMHACRKVGLVAVPMGYRFTSEEMRHVLSDSGASVVVVDAEQAPLVGDLTAVLPQVRAVVIMQGEPPGFLRWDEVVAMGDETEPPLPDPGGLGSAMMYTSGTTGRPKGAVRSRTDRALLGAMLAELNFGRDEVHLTTGPLYHAGPNAFALLTHLLGGTVVVMRQFDAAQWVELVSRHRVTSTFSAPTQMKRVVDLPHDVLARADLSSLRTLIVNAAPVPYSLKQDIVAKLGDGCLYEVYGSTELGIDTVLRPEDQLRKPGSCGRPYGGIELKVVDEQGRDLPPGQAGELFVRTAMAVDGYHGTLEQLAELPGTEPGAQPGTDEVGGGWKSVGDIAYLDDEGYVYICDRKIDMIITGGVNVYPAEIEGVLHSHPAVLDVAVVGLPDDEWGERVHAVVQPKPGMTVDLEELRAHAATRLANNKVPRSWEVRHELPRTESGKLRKRLLRDERASSRTATG